MTYVLGTRRYEYIIRDSDNELVCVFRTDDFSSKNIVHRLALEEIELLRANIHGQFKLEERDNSSRIETRLRLSYR